MAAAAQLFEDWKSHGQWPIPDWLQVAFKCVLKHLSEGAMPATVWVCHHWLHDGSFTWGDDDWPVPIYEIAQFAAVGQDILKQTREFMMWLSDKERQGGTVRVGVNKLLN
jgi:hypothetical protein